MTVQYNILIFAQIFNTMAGRPKIFDEQQALRKATNLFWEKGYAAASTEDLISVMGLQRGSFYHTFGSKKELYIASLNSHEKASFVEFRNQLSRSEAPIRVIKDAFLGLADCSPQEHMMGCFAGNTIAELSGIDEELVGIAKGHLKTLEAIFFKQIKSSQQSGELKTKSDAKLLARYLINFWNGINITRRMHHSKTELLALVEFQFAVLK